MSDQRVAARYAKSVVSLGQELNILDEIKSDMDLIAQTCDDSRPLRLLLANPIILSDKKFDILDEIFKGKVSELTTKFLKLVCRKGRERELMDIADKVISIYNEINGITQATVTTAIEVGEDVKAQFEQIIKDLTDSSKVSLTSKIDSSIMGGFVLSVGDRQIDDSVSSKLRQLRVQFARN